MQHTVHHGGGAVTSERLAPQGRPRLPCNNVSLGRPRLPSVMSIPIRLHALLNCDLEDADHHAIDVDDVVSLSHQANCIGQYNPSGTLPNKNARDQLRPNSGMARNRVTGGGPEMHVCTDNADMFGMACQNATEFDANSQNLWPVATVPIMSAVLRTSDLYDVRAKSDIVDAGVSKFGTADLACRGDADRGYIYIYIVTLIVNYTMHFSVVNTGANTAAGLHVPVIWGIAVRVSIARPPAVGTIQRPTHLCWTGPQSSISALPMLRNGHWQAGWFRSGASLFMLPMTIIDVTRL